MRALSIREMAPDVYKLPKGTTLIRLACGHEGLYARPTPKPGESAYCRECREFTTRSKESGGHVLLRTWLHLARLLERVLRS